VRRADLVSAPVAVPVGFAAGVLPLCDGTGGFSGRMVGLFTALAMNAGWLYGGTLIAGMIATVRKIRLMRRQAVARQRGAGTAARGTGRGTAPGAGGRGLGGPAGSTGAGAGAGARVVQERLRAAAARQAPPRPRRRPA
jgi:hypothetical protein